MKIKIFEGHHLLISFHQLYIHTLAVLPLLPSSIKVWGPYSYKLQKSSNFVRFYAPDYLYQYYQSTRMLYLDTDTYAIDDIGLMYFTTMVNHTSFASGIQNIKNCHFAKIFHLQHDVIRPLHIDPNSACLTASVLLIDINRLYIWHVIYNMLYITYYI